jgi:sec-independent protein translocase protein TatB
VFGFSFGELVILVIVAIVVIGPKDMPRVLRQLGQWASRLRRMATDLRVQSGIDDILRHEGIAEDIAEIRKLARGELEGVARAVRMNDAPPPAAAPDYSIPIEREREHPTIGPDTYGALPDTAVVYVETLPLSPLAKDPLYVHGDPDAKIEPAVDPPTSPASASGAANDAKVAAS